MNVHNFLLIRLAVIQQCPLHTSDHTPWHLHFPGGLCSAVSRNGSVLAGVFSSWTFHGISHDIITLINVSIRCSFFFLYHIGSDWSSIWGRQYIFLYV